MKTKFFLLFIVMSIFIACNSKDDPMDNEMESPVLDCDGLITGLLDQDEDALETILNPELANLTFLDQDNNLCLHDNNLKAFVDFLNESCDELSAEIICCGCIKTGIPQSEVSVIVDSVDVEVMRVLDLETPEEEGIPLSFAGVHL